MKKVLSAVLVCVILACSVFALTSCGNELSGTYEHDETKLHFDGDKVTYTVPATYLTPEINIDGTYEIVEDEDEKLFITLKFNIPEGLPEATLGFTTELINSINDGLANVPFFEGEDYIKINDTVYTRVND